MSTRRTSISAFLDTSAFIPLLDEANVLHAKLVQHLSAAKAFVGIDTVVLSEFLVGMADAFEREAIAEKCTRQFRVYSFDTQTAVVCAELFKILKGKGQIPKTPTKRQLTKVDVMIMHPRLYLGPASLFLRTDTLPTILHYFRSLFVGVHFRHSFAPATFHPWLFKRICQILMVLTNRFLESKSRLSTGTGTRRRWTCRRLRDGSSRRSTNLQDIILPIGMGIEITVG